MATLKAHAVAERSAMPKLALQRNACGADAFRSTHGLLAVWTFVPS